MKRLKLLPHAISNFCAAKTDLTGFVRPLNRRTHMLVKMITLPLPARENTKFEIETQR